jgi:hypothetical protein
MKSCLAATVLLTIAGFAAAGGGEMPTVAKYSIDLAYRAEDPGIEALADVTFVEGSAVPGELVFYLHGELWVDEVTMDGDPVDVARDLVWYPSDYSGVAQRTQIDMTGREMPKRLSIRYSGKLNPSVARAPSNYMRVDPDGIFLRSYGYSLWFPTFLEADRDTYTVAAEITVRTPAKLMAVVTGERLEDTVDGDLRVSRWRTADDIFNIQLTARPFRLIQEGGFHLYSLRDAESNATAAQILSFTSKLQEFFKENYSDGGGGGQLHVVQMPRFGDISSGNMVGISDRIWRGFDPASYSGRTLAHELVHPFVQLPLPRRSEFYAFVIEGFPSYFHLPAMAPLLGEEFYRNYMARVQEAYLQRRETGLDRRGNQLPEERPLLELTVADIPEFKDRFVLADRALLFFNWLRERMGTDNFAAFTKELFALETLDFENFAALIQFHLPGSKDDVDLWLRTTEFPARFRLKAQNSRG